MFDDLVQVCFERAMKVVHRFDPDIAEFATFITSWLRPAIDDYVSQSLQIPVQLLKNRRKIARAIRLQQERGIIPTPASVRAEYGYSKTHVAAVLEGRGMFSALQSISEPIGNGLDGDAQSLEDLLESDEKPVLEHIASTEAVSLLNQAMATLTERDHFVIESRAFKGLTLWQVGELLEVTPERARQIEVKAKQKLRTYLEDRGLTHDALF
jgi:RNA polymerase sigma factor (sigma-70 family)